LCAHVPLCEESSLTRRLKEVVRFASCECNDEKDSVEAWCVRHVVLA
jgi:hypothetical protein